MKQNFSFAQFAQNRKLYAKCNFLGTLSKIDIKLRSKQLKIYSIHKKILIYEYDNDITITQLVASSNKKLKLRDQN